MRRRGDPGDGMTESGAVPRNRLWMNAFRGTPPTSAYGFAAATTHMAKNWEPPP